MKQRVIALLLALALLAAVPAVSALAEERTAPADASQPDQAAAPEGEAAEPASEPGEAEAGPAAREPEEDPLSPAGPDLAENVTIQPDPLGEVSFANVERRMRENNFQILTIEQNVLSIEDIEIGRASCRERVY